MDPRSIDPSQTWVRHIVRGEAGDLTATEIAGVHFVRDDVVRGEDGLNGRQGWQQAEVTVVLSDDGSFQLALPNVAGDDGVLHRRRFRILTDPDYEPGEEWLEFWSTGDQENPLAVGTPTDYEKSKTTVTIRGADLPVVLVGSISSDVDVWDGTAPTDVLAHYCRLNVLAHGEDLAATLTGTAGGWSGPLERDLDGVAADCWTVEARVRWTSPTPAAQGASKVRLALGGLSLEVDVFDGATSLGGVSERPVVGKRQGLTVPGPVSLRVVARYDHVFAFVAGELVAEFRRPSPWPALDDLAVAAYGGTVHIDGLQVDTLADFASRGPSAAVDRRIPGLPPAIGLRGRYWNAAAVYAQNSTLAGRVARLWPIAGEADPVTDRVDPTLAFPAGTASYPPGLPGAYAARWTGAIWLDLAAGDRAVRLSGLVGNARLYIGRTLRGQEAASSWTAAPATTPLATGGLRDQLGQVAGWFPIVVEHTHDSAAAGIVLEDSALDGGGAPAGWATVPQSRLTPYGCYDDLVRLTPHRNVIGDVSAAFGHQWRVEPRSLESGEFPGQIVFAAMVGRQTEIEVDDQDVGSDAEVTGAAGDVVDGLLADAAGLADPDGSGQLTVQTVDYARAGGHMALRQAYESLSEISEPVLAQTRVDSMLALRSSPNEQVGVRPSGQRDLVDTFPLTGDLARMDWKPGDAVRLRLDSVDVMDLSPRQMTTVTWTPRRDGLGPPTVGFRQRPRTVKAAMKRLTAAIFGPRRNYQGQAALMTGSVGGATSAGAPANGAVDGYSRAPLPADLDNVAQVVACVQALTGNGWRLEVAGQDLGVGDGSVTTVGRYDITRAVRAAALGAPLLAARLIGGTGGSYQLTLEIRVRV